MNNYWKKLKSFSDNKNSILSIDNNQHILDITSVKDELSLLDHDGILPDRDCFLNDEDIEKCIKDNVLWEIRYYPHGTVSFWNFYGSSLEIVIDLLYNETK